MTSHWLPNVERRGLGGCVVSVNHIALIVSDVGRSLRFYTDVLGLQQIQRPNFDRHGAWLTAGNVEIHLIKGKPLVHTGENLIVNHIALDVKDPVEVFEGLKDMKVPFEINVSVPKGEGKAESEGGSRDNTLSQAFLRDPDGYYIEMCNCDILTDFALGRSSGLVDRSDSVSLASSSTWPCGKISLYAMAKMVALASRAKKACRVRKDQRTVEIEALCVEEQPSRADATIMENFLARRAIYGDICQSFSKAELEDLLRQAGNSAPRAHVLMQGRFQKGKKRLLYPPGYYVECSTGRRKENDSDYKFVPDPFEERRKSSFLHVMTASLSRLVLEPVDAVVRRNTTLGTVGEMAANALGRSTSMTKSDLSKRLSSLGGPAQHNITLDKESRQNSTCTLATREESDDDSFDENEFHENMAKLGFPSSQITSA